MKETSPLKTNTYQEFRDVDASDWRPLVVVDDPNGHASGGATDGDESVAAPRQDHATCGETHSFKVTLYFNLIF